MINPPKELLTAIHGLFCTPLYIWLHTCKQEKKANSALVQEGRPTRYREYRPIALADTLTKLYTGLLTDCMTDLAEYHDTLSTSQEVFRWVGGMGASASSHDAKSAELCKTVWRGHLYGVDRYLPMS